MSVSPRTHHPVVLDAFTIVMLYTRLFAVPFLTAKNTGRTI